MSLETTGRLSVIPARALSDPRVSPAALRVLAALGAEHDSTEGWFEIRQAELGALLGVSRPAVARQVRLLVESGYIEAEAMTEAHGGRTHNRYRILFDRIGATPPVTSRYRGAVTSDESAPVTSRYGLASVENLLLHRVQESPPLPLTGEHPPTGGEPERGTRLPADWTLPAAWRQWAVAEGFHMKLDIDNEAAIFRDYWVGKTGQGATKRDWLATWRNWLRRAVQHGNRNRQAPHRDAYAGNRGFIDAVARSFARQADNPDDGG